MILLVTLVLAVGTACSWGGDDASGGDAAQTHDVEDGDTGGGDEDTDGGAKPSPVRVARATEQISPENPVPVGVVADQAADQMATDECPGGELCVEIDIQPDDRTCMYIRAEPAAGELIDIGATLTLFGDCRVHLVPDPDNEGQYIKVGTEGTDEPSAPSSPSPTQPSPPTAPSPAPPEGPSPEPAEGGEG
ncbi:hypothetical protein GCM10027059_49350 [Myceligenerans halotolerans]